MTSTKPIVKYLVHWRMEESLRRVTRAAKGRLSHDSRVLVICAGEGYEGSVLCDLGYTNVTVSDISPAGVAEATKRDPRLKGMVADAERMELPPGAFDLVLVQDGLHHLPNPVGGFVEMLRVAKVAAFFLEPHDSFVGNRVGTRWEKQGDAVNYVFRWNKKLVEDVASSFLGQHCFENLSFSFWHHNIMMQKIAERIGGQRLGVPVARAMKASLDVVLPGLGNQFCGMIVKR